MGIIKTFVVTSPEAFEPALSSALNGFKNVFVSFISNLDPVSNQLWCPDCRASEPVVKKAFEESKHDICIVECQIPRDGYKGNPEHPYRTHPQIQLKFIPTLISWNKEGPQTRLVDSECSVPEKVQSVIPQ
eukprot:gene404-509_t